MRRQFLTFLATISLAATASAATVEERFDRTFDVRPGGSLVLSNTNGRVTVKAWDQPRIRVQAEKKVESRNDEAARNAMRELKIETSSRDGGLVIETRYPRKNDLGFFDFLMGEKVNAQVSYELMVPRSMNVDLETVNGRITVSDISGNLEVETTNGRIDVERCAGTLDASTTNGAITAELTQVATGKPMRLSTTNGRIKLTVPPTFAANIDASTTNGDIDTDLPLTTKSARSNSLRGSVNGGGAELKLRTTNGGIEIRTR